MPEDGKAGEKSVRPEWKTVENKGGKETWMLLKSMRN